MVGNNKKEIIKCNICDSDLDIDSGDIVGNFGITPVAFCVWCYSSMRDMVIQLNGFNDRAILQGRIDELKEEEQHKDYHNALRKMYKKTKERIRQIKKEKMQ